MLSEIISKVSVSLVGLLIICIFLISGIFLTGYCWEKIEKILIKKNAPKWVVSTLGYFFTDHGHHHHFGSISMMPKMMRIVILSKLSSIPFVEQSTLELDQ